MPKKKSEPKIGRPLKGSEPRQTYSIRIPPSTRDAVMESAIHQGISVSDWYNEAIDRHLRRSRR